MPLAAIELPMAQASGLRSIESLPAAAMAPFSPAEKSARLAALRGLLEEKFPAAEIKTGGVMPTGIEAIDVEEGGLRRGAITELVAGAGGGGLFIEAMLEAVAGARCFMALVDGAGSFDPQGCAGPWLERLLWVRCGGGATAVKAADFLLRDGNLSLVLLDLQMLPRREVQRIPASTWHRFQRLVEEGSAVFVVLTVRPGIESASRRIVITRQWSLETLRERRHQLRRRLEARVFSRRRFAAAPEIIRRSA
jgi:hypothetical protein